MLQPARDLNAETAECAGKTIMRSFLSAYSAVSALKTTYRPLIAAVIDRNRQHKTGGAAALVTQIQKVVARAGNIARSGRTVAKIHTVAARTDIRREGLA